MLGYRDNNKRQTVMPSVRAGKIDYLSSRLQMK